MTEKAFWWRLAAGIVVAGIAGYLIGRIAIGA